MYPERTRIVKLFVQISSSMLEEVYSPSKGQFTSIERKSKNKEQAKEINEKIKNIKENCCLFFRFRSIWMGLGE